MLTIGSMYSNSKFKHDASTFTGLGSNQTLSYCILKLCILRLKVMQLIVFDYK